MIPLWRGTRCYFQTYRGKIEDEEFDYHLLWVACLGVEAEKILKGTTGYLEADPKRVEDLSQELGIGNKELWVYLGRA